VHILYCINLPNVWCIHDKCNTILLYWRTFKWMMNDKSLLGPRFDKSYFLLICYVFARVTNHTCKETLYIARLRMWEDKTNKTCSGVISYWVIQKMLGLVWNDIQKHMTGTWCMLNIIEYDEHDGIWTVSLIIEFGMTTTGPAKQLMAEGWI